MRSAVLAVLAVGAHASVPADFVARLPGYASPLPSKLYSGYLNSNPGKHAHYMFSESLRAPSKDPIVLWFNVSTPLHWFSPALLVLHPCAPAPSPYRCTSPLLSPTTRFSALAASPCPPPPLASPLTLFTGWPWLLLHGGCHE